MNWFVNYVWINDLTLIKVCVTGIDYYLLVVVIYSTSEDYLYNLTEFYCVYIKMEFIFLLQIH